MRIRTIKPTFWTNDELAELDALTRLLFIGLWNMADVRGRLEDRPKRIKAAILPYDDCSVDAALDALAHAGFIIRYTYGDLCCIQIVNFEKHQRITGKEADTESDFPSISDADVTILPVKQRGNNWEAPGSPEGRKEWKGREVLPEPIGETPDLIAPPEPTPSPVAAGKQPREKAPATEKPQRQRNPLWDSVCEVCGVDAGAMTATITSLIGRAVKEIKEANPDVTPDMVRRKAAAYRKQYPECALTVSALKKHWSTLSTATPAYQKPHIGLPPGVKSLDEQEAECPFRGETFEDMKKRLGVDSPSEQEPLDFSIPLEQETEA